MVVSLFEPVVAAAVVVAQESKRRIRVNRAASVTSLVTSLVT